MNSNDQLFHAMLEMGCKVITERPQPLIKLRNTKRATNEPKTLVWRLVESKSPHLRSHNDIFTIYRDKGVYTLFKNGVTIGKFANCIDARNYASNSWVDRRSLRK